MQSTALSATRGPARAIFFIFPPLSFLEHLRLHVCTIKTFRITKSRINSNDRYCKHVAKKRVFHRTVTVEEAEEYCNSQDDCCVFVEASAKRNYHVEELFYQLFVVAGLPLEMAPNHHRKVPLTFGSPTMLPPSQVNDQSLLHDFACSFEMYSV